ncbi:putative palmitoyltransferase ZDHHC23 isoform X2 [Apostichopus japonicus]|uniref:Palmitoyltransferase n=1 Tax=Stichopus japonicus TaxID=307972 RepID=A0A2G8JQG4_STIJA|nr:putative palmitoyltransferase ZDHHC23 isoform X2 [Apostichopus japonicus]
MDDSKDGPLCCCEYINHNGESSHILAICCDCEDLDGACDSLLKGEAIGDETVNLISEDVLDRIRIPNPFGGGAKRIDHILDLTIFPPILCLPLGIYVSALNPVLTLIVCFVVAPLSIYWYYRKVLKHRKRTQFFMSWALTSFASMYTLMVLVIYPEDVISQPEFAAMTLLFVFFHVCFFNTKRGAGSVTYDPPSNGIKSKPKQPSRKRNHVNLDSQLQEPSFCQDHHEAVSITEGDQPHSTENWCQVCQIPRPPRAGHCRICSSCFPRLDHHCVWLDCCIGRENHRSFILCLLVFILGCLWGSLRVIVILFGGDEEEFLPMCLEVYASRTSAIVFVSSLYVLGSGISVTSLLLHQVWLISHNWTFRERRLAKVTNSESRLSELDKGFFKNWQNFLFGNLE